MTPEEEMDAAIAASLSDMAAERGAVINEWTDHVDRSACVRADEHAPERVSSGSVRQWNSLDQHSQTFHEAIEKYSAPKSSCGAFSCAAAVILSQQYKIGDDFETVMPSLQNVSEMEPEVRKVMAHMEKSRATYIMANKSDFKSPGEERQYMTAWAANYELSDYLKDCAKAGRIGPNVFFLRYNQWPERNTASHEELQRLVEEEPFGGHNTGDKANVQLEEGAQRFILERFLPDGTSQLQSTDEFLKGHKSFVGAIFVLDLNGHFATAVASGPLHDPTLIVVNTTRGNYIRSGGGGGCIPLVAFDLAYPGS